MRRRRGEELERILYDKSHCPLVLRPKPPSHASPIPKSYALTTTADSAIDAASSTVKAPQDWHHEPVRIIYLALLLPSMGNAINKMRKGKPEVLVPLLSAIDAFSSWGTSGAWTYRVERLGPETTCP